ncbi:sugar ABC transporter substrate-binding protein [Trueperella pyogenes]|uniref:ABC transporter substrate-binding protein n=2 Tax=Trueperella pyogenes TaxID=1661 RepID=UPI000D258C5A|nr:sugar ABC transporter substrate-binding protein [Trueperella pyogenes]AWA44139.1 sugar ABC transporter substrate-binding protein [Trueperella pyogenes]AWG03354.1 sugar ABC transporter substrate-binding protein [Trueperella pyogenes]AWG16085.1 sugar ABC transporter substrate-binding protein [Trueperella pyogenes]AZR04968.1 sugar ABC transporter substrate-binding protein [Trueperella pyogenes]UVJ54051.1 sugar ABC transporter substrate-binding protein [Trueperella pyogenes]
MKVPRLSRAVAIGAAAALALGLSGCGGESNNSASEKNGEITLKFSQWWEPELPEGSLRGLMDQFEKDNPGIKVELISGPYASTKEQMVAGAASHTMADVVGLDGAWVSDFAKQGAIADLSSIMSGAGYDEKQLASQIKVDDKTFMIPVVNFAYPMFTNTDLLKKAGVEKAPDTRADFAETAKKVKSATGANGWVIPLSLEAPNGIQNDVMSWVWATGGSMLTGGKPAVTNNEVKSTLEFIKTLWDDGVVAPGAYTMKEQDKVEEFSNGRVAMMIDSLAHINLIRKNNPNLNFDISAMPATDNYSGKRGMAYASWGIGVSANTKYQDAAWKLVEFLLSPEANAKLCEQAHAFPGNVRAKPNFDSEDPLFQKAFQIWSDGVPANEFTGLPVAEELMRAFSQNLQKALEGSISIDDALKAVQSEWESKF